jgi:tight adherence protein B
MILILTTIFFATLAVVVVGYVVVNRQDLASAELARTRLQPEELAKTWTLLKDESVSDVPFIQRLLDGKRFSYMLRLQLQQAGMTMKPGAFLLVWVAIGMTGTLLATMLLHNILITVPVSLFCWAAPYLWLKRRQKKRLTKFNEQLPDAIDMLVSAMRAGYSFQAATQFIGEEMIDPLGAEFARFYDEQRLGIEVRIALLNLQNRIDSLDLKMFVTAVVIQRETGGNLSEVLSGLADLIRGRMAIKGHIETLVAEPKMSAKFLALIPVIVFFIIFAINPAFMQPMLRSGGGRIALAGASFSVLVGYMVMMKIADVDI